MSERDARVEDALRSLHPAVRAAVVATSPAAIRRRAKRRTVRRGVAGLAAVLAAVAAAAGLVALSPAAPAPPPPPPPGPTSAPPVTASASPPSLRSLALRPAQLGAGYSVDGEYPPSPFPGGTVPGEACGAWSPPPSGAARHVLGAYYVLFNGPNGVYEGHEIWQFDTGWAATAMGEIRDRLRLCARQEEPADPGVTAISEWTPLANGFAGADSVVVRHTVTRNGTLSNTDFYLVVRQGELLGTLWLVERRWTQAQLLDLGRALAARLCAAGMSC